MKSSHGSSQAHGRTHLCTQHGPGKAAWIIPEAHTDSKTLHRILEEKKAPARVTKPRISTLVWEDPKLQIAQEGGARSSLLLPGTHHWQHPTGTFPYSC